MLLIDEVDKADVEFPNDLLRELDEMRFTVLETGDEVVAAQRPVVIITSNNEKELPDAFLRRCVFYFIEFPDVAADEADRRRPPPEPRRHAARPGADQVLLAARAERAAQEAVDVGADRLDRGAAALGRHAAAGGAAPAVHRHAAQDRAGHRRARALRATAAARCRASGRTSVRSSGSRRSRCSSSSSTACATRACPSRSRSG